MSTAHPISTNVRRASAHVLLGAVPIAAVVTMFAIAHSTRTIGADFHNEIYPQAKLMLSGENPYPPPGSDLTDGSNFVWPPVAVFVAAPLTLLAPDSADAVAAGLELAAFLAALWLVGVRDWRVFGAGLLWPQVLGEIRVAHYSLILCLLVAVAWRMRARNLMPGLAIGAAIAVKFFVWPLVLWLAALRRYRDAALAAVLGAASLLLVLPFTSPIAYLRMLRELGAAYNQDSYSPYGLAVQAGAPSIAGSALTLVLGLGLLGLAFRRRSFALVIGSALVLSPIAWLDYYALLALPLAIAAPTFRPIWLLPLVTWGMPSAGPGVGDALHSLRLLGPFAVLLWYVTRAEGRPVGASGPRDAGSRLSLLLSPAHRRNSGSGRQFRPN